MTTKEQIAREVEATLSLLDHKGGWSARPDFEARLRARLREEDAGRRSAARPLLKRRSLIPAVAAAILAMNVGTAVLVLRKAHSGPSGRQEAISTLAEELSLKASPGSKYWE